MKDENLKALEQLIINNPDLERLEASLKEKQSSPGALLFVPRPGGDEGQEPRIIT